MSDNLTDRAFFARHPTRKYRLRLATSYEMACARSTGVNFSAAIEPDTFFYVLVPRAGGFGLCTVFPLPVAGGLDESALEFLWHYVLGGSCEGASA
jgi:hypothetical protein